MPWGSFYLGVVVSRESSRQAALTAWKEDCADMDRFAKDPGCEKLVGSIFDHRGKKIESTEFIKPSTTVLKFTDGTDFSFVALDDGN